ncbi:MAG TPA: IclR family transcriptional regulator C-terminal domain-containing protein [Actinomycetes bacterium]|nr:IclR family transcriptional regulator C-terminal domain-containing protein [Actinomycetes bacterium]
MSAQFGGRRPLHCTALGKAYLAALPGQELEAV